LVLISHDRRPPHVPASGHGERVLNAIQLIDKLEGEFTDKDEALLRPLANRAGMAMENARLYEELPQRDRRQDEFPSSGSPTH
jgi:GAF domain-containing protein